MKAAGGKPEKTLVIGIGNRWRGDDGAGLLLTDALGLRLATEPKLANAFEVYPCSGEAANLLEQWRGRDHVVIVDAIVAAAAQPGGLLHLDALDPRTAPLPVLASSTSSHAFGLAAAIGLAKELQALPRHLDVIGIVGKEFTVGSPASPAVAAAVTALVAAWSADMQDLWQRLPRTVPGPMPVTS